MNKEQEWWFYRSPLTKKYLQIMYYPATNWEYLSQEQIIKIFKHENKTLWNQNS